MIREEEGGLQQAIEAGLTLFDTDVGFVLEGSEGDEWGVGTSLFNVHQWDLLYSAKPTFDGFS
jgi:hypothetical protein